MNKILEKYLPDWTIESDNSVDRKIDINKLSFFTGLKDGETYITGKERLDRLREDKIELFGIEEWARLYEEKGQKTLRAIYDKHKVTWIEFVGTVLRNSNGDRSALYLYRTDDGSWYWFVDWLADDRYASDPAAGVASTSDSETKPSSDPLNLELSAAIKVVKENGYKILKIRNTPYTNIYLKSHLHFGIQRMFVLHVWVS